MFRSDSSAKYNKKENSSQYIQLASPLVTLGSPTIRISYKANGYRTYTCSLKLSVIIHAFVMTHALTAEAQSKKKIGTNPKRDKKKDVIIQLHIWHPPSKAALQKGPPGARVLSPTAISCLHVIIPDSMPQRISQ